MGKNIINLDKEKEKRDNIKREKGTEILNEHQKNIEEYEAFLTRLDIKESAGRDLNEKDVASIFYQMGKLAKSDQEKTEKMNELYGKEGEYKSVSDHIKEEYNILGPEL